MAKRNSENSTIGDALKDFIKTNNLSKGLDKVNVTEAWHTVMGTAISGYTAAVKLEGDTIYVQLNSSVLREELSYGKEKIINMLNDELGREIIKKLILR